MSKEYKKGLVSICCLGYKHKEFLTDCIESIWEQDYKNIEIIAMDDCSKDGSDELLDELSKKSPFPMKVLKQENTGRIAYNANKLISYASGEYISFISLDDVFAGMDVISNHVEFIEKINDCKFSASVSYIKIINNITSIEKSPIYDKFDITDVDEMLKIRSSIVSPFYLPGNVFLRDFVDGFGGFDDDLLGDDIVFLTKVLLELKKHSNYNFKLIQKPSIIYRIHGDNIHKNLYRQILIITQWLDRYFPNNENPKILKDWLLSALYEYEKDYKDCYKYLQIKRLEPYYKEIKKAILKKRTYKIRHFFKNIFNVNNQYSNGYKIKIFTIIFIKIPIKKIKSEGLDE